MFITNPMSADEIFEKTMSTMAALPCQESCARTLCSIFSYHLTKISLMDAGFGADELPQLHAIMVAPTGTGKTYLLKHIAKSCGINMIFMDGSSLSRDGWKGPSFGQQLSSAKNSLQDDDAFARSVLFLDEADKMRLYNRDSDAGNVMDNLLQLFNSGEIAVEVDPRQVEKLDVSRFTIIMGGAFEGLEDIIRKRIAPKVGIGFGATSIGNAIDDKTIMEHASIEDLQAYGMKKELVARIGSIITINPMETEDYRQLLTASIGSIRANYRNFLLFGYGVDFDISENAVEWIARHCVNLSTGARAVVPLVNSAMNEAIAKVSTDERINKVILSANNSGCVLCYEYGDRDISCYNTHSPSADSYCLAGETLHAVSLQLCEEYRLAGCPSEFEQEFKVFVDLTLTYLYHRCGESEFHLESLRKFAKAADKSSRRVNSPLEIIITDYLQILDHPKEIDEYFKDFKQTWTRQTSQRISKALTLIRCRLIKLNGAPHIRFYISSE